MVFQKFNNFTKCFLMVLAVACTNLAENNNGNTRANGANTFAYGAENRLTNFNNASASYVYNGNGLRVRKTVGGTSTLYLRDDRNPAGYAQAFEEATVTGSVTNLAVIYLVGLDLVSQNRSVTVSYCGYDGNSNARYLAGSGSSITPAFSHWEREARSLPSASL